MPPMFRPRLRWRQRLLLSYVAVVAAVGGMLWCMLPAQRAATTIMAAVGLGAAWLIAGLGNRRIRRRLHELREAADALGGGDLARRIHSLPNDDFTKISESVDRLALQLREMSEEQARLRQSLSRSEKLAVIGELAATVAHEINNPLDGLQNCTKILRRPNRPPGQCEQLLDMMESGLHRMELIVRRLLSMSRDEPIALAPTSLQAVCEDAAFFAAPRLNRHGVKLVRDFPVEPLIVQADAQHLAQALLNLMINAADAMVEGGTLTVRGRADGGGRVTLDVIDTGSGVEPAHLPHIFEPFYSTKPGGRGTGLGLSVVARIVAAHQGTIDVRSEPGLGTTFSISLPAGITAESGAGSSVSADTRHYCV